MKNNIDKIASILMQLLIEAKHEHLNTTSYAQHKAFELAYDALSDLADDILEKLMGYNNNVRIGTIDLSPCEGNKTLAEDIIVFAEDLRAEAVKNKWSDVENLAQELSGLGAKLKYLLSLK